MEGASGGWSDMNHTTGPAFDVGMAFSEAELDFILFEELLDTSKLHVMAHAGGSQRISPPFHESVRGLDADYAGVHQGYEAPALRSHALQGTPFTSSMATPMQPRSQYIADFGHDTALGLAGSGFGLDAMSEQELLGTETASELSNGKRRRATERRGARSTSKYRGVTHHCRTGRWEAHLWQNARQVYLGGFDAEEQAALAYDIAAIKCRGREAQTNFPLLQYEQELQNLERVTTEELVLSLRRQSKGFTRGSSKFRGVTRHQKGRWEARIGQLTGRKYRYLGLFDSEVEAAVAYDREAVRQKGLDACTNFELSSYADILAQRINDADGTSLNGAIRTGPVHSASASDCAAASLSHPRLPGPAITVEPSAEAQQAVQAMFARHPEMVLGAGMAEQHPPAPSAFEYAVAAPLSGSMPAHAVAKRPRRECSTPMLPGLDGVAASGALLADAAMAAAGPADTAVVPATPQLPRRTSAPY